MAEGASRRGVLAGFGVVVLVVGLVAALALWSAADDRRRDAVEGFARAPVGCDTTLDFVETGEYFVFIERAGRFDGIRGDCDVEGAYDVGSVTPDVDITIVDPEGSPVELGRTVSGLDYSEAGFVGAAAFTVEIVETDDHVVRVESPDDEVFVIAVGRDPSDGVALLKGGAAVLGLLGLLLGGGLILLGARRSTTPVAAPQWAPGAVAPPAPFTPGRSPQGPPVYGQPAGPPQYPRPAPGQPPQPPQYGQPQRAPDRPQPSAPAPRQHPAGPPSIPGQPSLPGQPGWGPAPPPPPPPPPVPRNSAADDLPTERAPQDPEHSTGSAATAPSNEDFPARLRDERRSGAVRPEERPPPPPPPS